LFANGSWWRAGGIGEGQMGSYKTGGKKQGNSERERKNTNGRKKETRKIDMEEWKKRW
jgi:hypothetical protein